MPCSILVRGKNNSHPTKDYATYKRGDPVVVMRFNHVYGKLEKAPNFYIIRISDVSVAQAQKYIGEHSDGNGAMLRRRLFKIKVDSIPSSIKTILASTGEITVTKAQIRNYIQNKITSVTE